MPYLTVREGELAGVDCMAILPIEILACIAKYVAYCEESEDSNKIYDFQDILSLSLVSKALRDPCTSLILPNLH